MKINHAFLKETLAVIVLFCIAAGVGVPVEAKLVLTPEEAEYIAGEKTIKAVSIDGGAPLHYRDSKGHIRGIAISVLDEIAAMTGLIFEYRLYDSIEQAFKSKADIYFGVTHQYAPEGMILSQPYLNTETILFINSSLDPNELENKTYAALKGGDLPEGINRKNTIYYNNREETMDAVEKGKADYGFGNEYSLAFYMLQNGYKNIVTIPRAMETREYCVGFPDKNEVLLSIINKSIHQINENRMQTLILDVASNIDRKVTFSMIINSYGKEIFILIILLMGILLFSALFIIRANKQLRMQNKRYELLSHISNECLFEYHLKTDQLSLSDKCTEIIGVQGKNEEIINLLKETLSRASMEIRSAEIKIPLDNNRTRVFRIITSGLYDDWGNIYSVAGKLIDISDEYAEREILISKSQMDGLTGLYNAITARERISRSIANRGGDSTDAFIIIDCDNFKKINDVYGHLKGDQVLVSISKNLGLVFRQTDIMGRIGGDEFCVYMHNIPSEDFIRSKCQKLLYAIQEMNQDIPIMLSMGVAILRGESNYEELFRKADKALYRAKKRGGAQIAIYEND